MHQGAIQQATNLEAALMREPHERLTLVNSSNSKWDILQKQASRIYHYRITQHNLSSKDKEDLMLARNEILCLAKSLKAVTAIEEVLNEEL
ncbi:hypothetical protein [Kiloniella antarctica]|uniref:Uncharacterized protein n=1 Tax=Kiloniella antarctica TaxID=1550907 RepID=A0ABW5BNS4_9PROT